MPERAKRPRPRRAKRKSPADRGYDRRWRRERLAYLAGHPLCVACLQNGQTVEATVVDHVVPHHGQQDPLFWDCQNWQSLCKPCHDSKTMAEWST